MAGQGVGRREVLRMLSAAAGVAAIPGFHKWLYAFASTGKALVQIKPAAYHPAFFTSQEYVVLDCLTEIIIPATDTPGARAAGVAEFIDVMTARDPELQHTFRAGLAWLNTRSKSAHSRDFLALSPAQQTAILEPLAYKAKYRPGEQAGRDFFDLLREYTVMGYYTSEIGLKDLDFPGLQFYADSPACPHPNDPEHRHLPPPRY